MQKNITNVMAAINYIEEHLSGKLDLEIVANAVHYSKYHLHRVFTETVGLTIHDYVQRRQLTEAAKLLVFSDRPIIEIALIAGYESQQSFTGAFKDMYKKSPSQYRDEEEFYPLQLRYILNPEPEKMGSETDWDQEIVYAELEDIPGWMKLVRLVVDGFPNLKEEEYIENLKVYIKNKWAMMILDGNVTIGGMLVHGGNGSIDFLGIHPQYRKQGISKAFLKRAMDSLIRHDEVSITTFREGDKADPGYRNVLKGLGFAEAELLIEFGYPTQRLVLQRQEEVNL